MRTWNQLTKLERVSAWHAAQSILLGHIVEGVVEMKMPNKVLQNDLDSILSDMRKNETGPDLAKKALLKHGPIGNHIMGLALIIAENSMWSYNMKPIMEELK